MSDFEYPFKAKCKKCGEEILIQWSHKKQKEYATNSKDFKDWHKCYPLDYTTNDKEVKEAEKPITSADYKIDSTADIQLSKVVTIRVTRSLNYQTIEWTFESLSPEADTIKVFDYLGDLLTKKHAEEM